MHLHGEISGVGVGAGEGSWPLLLDLLRQVTYGIITSTVNQENAPNGLEIMVDEKKPDLHHEPSVPETLASWPSAQLPSISVVEDRVLNSFHLDNLSDLASSPFLVRAHALCLRIPGREVSHSPRHSRWWRVLQCITFLDLSTSRLSDSKTAAIWLTTRTHARLGRLCASLYARAQSPHPRAICEPPLSAAPLGRGGSCSHKARVPPRVSALCTLSLSALAHVDADARCVLLDAFRRGWEEATDIQREYICRLAVPRGGRRAGESVSMAWRGW
ncbi:hypothetical protein EDB84DRAFT_1575278 [Lactarius hengduanensis]|nr:hypothetical protein EDB84DRAFT_1575278 [Lactarius hengduanensis]